ncbi:MAG: pyruvate kinase, partial [Clostridia bacterium]|nr:pyruvate kinase [Clostridia bacterium]
NKTKIVCSIGPASSKVETLEKMIDAGMNVARFNMSHGTHESHKTLIEAVKTARANKGKSVGILIDTKGPEIRVKQFEKGKIFLKENDDFVLTTKEVLGNQERVSVTYKNLPKSLSKDTRILLNDGNIELKVKKLTATDITCTVVHGGELSNNKSINIPGVKTDMPYLSEQDKKDILFAKEMNADFLAISFVNTAQDVIDVKKYLKEINFKDIKIISKIESQEGVENFDKILKQSDGIMVARGDLGVEIDYEKLPILQKEFIEKSIYYGKIVITATQMLESMITNPRPTRAEISDVANAIFDGSTAIMLSGETASGNNVVESVATMKRIAIETENYTIAKNVEFKTHDTTKSLAYAVYALTQTEDVKAVLAVTKSGATVENISKFRPKIPIIASTPSEKVYNRMSILYGVNPVMDKNFKNIDELNNSSYKKALETKILKTGDKVVFVSGLVAGKSGSNLMLIKRL